MASSFLKKKAEEQAKKIDEQYGQNAYGGSKWREERTKESSGSNAGASSSSSTTKKETSTTTNTNKTSTTTTSNSKASSTLQKRAQAQAQKVDKELGADAYGGSKWRETQVARNNAVSNATPVADKSKPNSGYSIDAIRQNLNDSYTNVEAAAKRLSDYAASYNAPAEDWFDQLVTKYGGQQDETGTYIFSDQATLDAFAKERDAAIAEITKAEQEYSALYDEYNNLYSQYNEWNDLAENYKSDASGWEIAGNAFKSGLAQFNDALTGTADWLEQNLITKPLGALLGNDELYKNGIFYGIHDYYSDQKDIYDQELADSLLGKGKVAQIASELGVGATAALPNAALAIMTSGASAAAQGGAALTGAASTGLGATISNAVTTMAKNPMYWSSFAQTLGPDYEAAINNGATELQASATALISSLLNAGVEISGGIEVLPARLRGGDINAILAWVKSMPEEGLEEVIQRMVSGSTDKAIYDYDKPIYSATDPNAIINPKEMGKEFGMGAGVAAILGGPQTVAVKTSEAINNRRLGKIGSEYQVAAEDVIAEGLTFSEDSDAYKVATELQAKQEAGKTISDAEIGKQVVANQQAINKEQSIAEANKDPLGTLVELAKETVEEQNKIDLSEDVGQESSTQKASVPYNVMSMENPARQKALIDKQALTKKLGYGEEGMKLFNEIAAETDIDQQELMVRFDTPYQAGLTGLPMEKANLFDNFQTEAYNAGRLDHIARMAKDEQAKPSVIYSEAESGFDFSKAPSDLTQEQKDFGDFMAKAFGVKGVFNGYDGVDYNAKYNKSTGVVAFAQDFDIDSKLMKKLGSMDYQQKVEALCETREKSFVFYIAHEIADHVAANRAPAAMRAFNNAMYNYKQSKADGGNLARGMQTRYRDNNVDLTIEGAIEEESADSILMLYDGDEKLFMEAMRNVFNGNDTQAKEGAKIYKNKLDEIIQKLKAWLRKLTGKENAEARANVEQGISELEQLRNMFEKAMGEAMTNVKNARAAKQDIATVREGLGAGAVIQTNKDGEMLLAKSKDGSTLVYSIKTYKDGGKDKLMSEYARDNVRSEAKELSDSETQFSLRKKDPPKKTGIAYKVFYAKDGQLYPPMVANPGGAGTPVGVWLDADIGVAAAPSKTGRPQVQAGGKGTNASKSSLAFRPGWHLGDLPMATQFARKNPETGVKDLFPADFVWAECEYAMDVDYQEEAMSYGYTENGKFRHSYAGLPRLPEDGYYRYRTNPNPDTVPWVITGAMRVKRILTDAETDKILRDAGVEPMKRQGGPIDLEKLGIEAGEQFSVKGVENRGKQEYNGSTETQLSAKGKYWRPDLTKAQMKRLADWVKHDIKTSENSICDEANWTFRNFDGLPVFAIYSTLNQSDPTILYESKGAQAEFERGVLKNLMEDIGNGESDLRKSEYVGAVLSRSWMHKAGGVGNGNGAVGRGRNAGNAGVLRQQPERNPSAAFESVLRNLLQKEESGEQFSLKIDTDGVPGDVVQEAHDVVTALKRDGMASRYGVRKYASYSSNRIDTELQESVAEGIKDYAHSYIAWVDPMDFIHATTTTAEYRERIRREAGDLRIDDLQANVQPIYLIVNEKTGEIVGHEGRHRMTALMDAGVERVAVIVRVTDRDMLIDAHSDKYNGNLLWPRQDWRVKGQRFDTMRGAGFTMHNLLPLSERYADAARQLFSQVDGSVQFSLKGEQEMRREIERVRSEGRKAGKSKAEIESDVMAVVGPEYGQLLKTYGEIKRGEKPYREISVPRLTEEGRKVSQTVRTILEAQVTPDSAVPTIQEMITTGEFSYEVYSDRAARAAAEATIQNKGYQTALADWLADVRDGKVNKTNTALGWELYNQAATSGDLKTAMTILNGMVQHQRSAAQALQATRILKKLSPDAQLYGIQKTVDSINEELQQRYGRKSGKRSAIDSDNVPVELWMQKTGEILAEQLGSAVKQKTSKEKTVSQRVLADLRKLAKETVTPASRPADTRTEMDSIYDMFHNREQYEKALQAAKETVAKEYGDKPEIMAALDKWMNTAFDYTAQFTKEITGQTAIRIPTELAEKFLSQTDQEGRDEVTREIYRYVGSQMPSTFADKWNAWRYLAMLGNPRTHVRNVVGNFGFAPAVLVKDITATGIEKAVNFVSGGKIDRTKGMPTKKLLKAAWEDYANVADQIAAGGKYSDSFMKNQHIQEGREIFKIKPLEKARKLSSAALEMEDMWFARPHYAFALAQYCKAHGVTVDQLKNGKALGNARGYAIREAQKATYRDTNAFSNLMGRRFSEDGEYGWVGKTANVVVSGILPFRKTPANILARGVEYSPIGLLNGIKQALWDVQKEKKTAADAIDSIAAGLTGTGVLALGVYMAAQGLVRGAGGDDEEEKKFEELMGHQAYSLELPNGTSVTLDWLAPMALPFFVGVNIKEMAGENNGMTTMSDILKAIQNVSAPLLEMSCLQSLNDAFDSVGYARSNSEEPVMKVLATAVTSLLTQVIPTLSGQIERTIEDERMTTYTEKNAFLTSDMQYTLGKASAKLPGDFKQIPYVDAWGRTESTGSKVGNAFNNFLNPAYTSQIDTSAMEEELQRLYDATGEGSVLPSRADKKFTVNKEDKHLTAEEYVEYATEKGQMSYDMLEDLTERNEYANMDDAEKAKAVGLVYEYANAIAKTKVSDYDPTGWVAKAIEAERETGMDEMEYILYKMALEMADGEKETEQKANAISSMSSLSDEEIAFLWGTESASKAYDAGIDMRTYVDLLGDGKSVDVDKLVEAKDAGISIDTYIDYRDTLKSVDQPTESGKYGSYTNKEKAEAISSLNLKDKEIAYFWDTDEGYAALDAGVRMSKYVAFKAAMSDITADKDVNGKTISGSKKNKVIDLLNSMSLTSAEWNWLYGTENKK